MIFKVVLTLCLLNLTIKIHLLEICDVLLAQLKNTPGNLWGVFKTSDLAEEN
jgi:hypothetical protein